ncbi:hypothetical protein C8R43DRAFT_636097 [Mycena crocata]|nr:hypothetical protein C8R43DRAFT_636097 [Mycena crocata]
MSLMRRGSRMQRLHGAREPIQQAPRPVAASPRPVGNGQDAGDSGAVAKHSGPRFTTSPWCGSSCRVTPHGRRVRLYRFEGMHLYGEIMGNIVRAQRHLRSGAAYRRPSHRVCTLSMLSNRKLSLIIHFCTARMPIIVKTSNPPTVDNQQAVVSPFLEFLLLKMGGIV